MAAILLIMYPLAPNLNLNIWIQLHNYLKFVVRSYNKVLVVSFHQNNFIGIILSTEEKGQTMLLKKRLWHVCYTITKQIQTQYEYFMPINFIESISVIDKVALIERRASMVLNAWWLCIDWRGCRLHSSSFDEIHDKSKWLLPVTSHFWSCGHITMISQAVSSAWSTYISCCDSIARKNDYSYAFKKLCLQLLW